MKKRSCWPNWPASRIILDLCRRAYITGWGGYVRVAEEAKSLNCSDIFNMNLQSISTQLALVAFSAVILFVVNGPVEAITSTSFVTSTSTITVTSTEKVSLEVIEVK